MVVPYDLEKARPRRITPDERAFLETFQDEDASDADRIEGAVVG